MKEQRHPHPHVDPRQPRNNTRPGTNPPVFVWKPGGPAAPPFRLTVARDAACQDVCLAADGLADPMFLPAEALPAGRHFWKWSAGGAESEVFTFEMAPEAVVVEVPPASEWLNRLPAGHPRIFIRPEDLPALRASRRAGRAGAWEALQARAEEILSARHEIDPPPFLPDRTMDYKEFFRVRRAVVHASRRFVRQARTLALAYLACGERRYARAACRRMASISRWDPDGASDIGHNDEAHMSVIWDGPQVCDWVWEAFTAEERRLVIDQFRRRGQINYEYMHGRGMYGVERFDSHAGREIVFLAQIALVFHEHVAPARAWLEWLRPVLCGIWPIWAGDDGGWAEGPAYGAAYVDIMTMFATTLARGAGVDLYRRPFWANHARWRLWCVPPYSQWLGFGDCAFPPGRNLRLNADVVEAIQRQTGQRGLGDYVAACRRHHPPAPETPPEPRPQTYLADPGRAEAPPAPPPGVCRVFPAAGLAAIRTGLHDPGRDVAFLFRSAPLGSVSHSHADNNDLILHVAGEVLACPSGYYDGYASAHHAHCLWHTRSHNCPTLSEAGQLQRSRESRGGIENAFEDDRVVYFRGNADASYPLARRCRRHVLFLKPQSCFVLLDEFVPIPQAQAALQWNLHSFQPFLVDHARRTFRIERGGSSVTGHFLYHADAFFSLSEGFDPPPMQVEPLRAYPNQHHLRFSLTGLGPANLAVVLAPAHAGLRGAEVSAERSGRTERARIGDDLVVVNQGAGIALGDFRSAALAVVEVARRRYELTDQGLSG